MKEKKEPHVHVGEACCATGHPHEGHEPAHGHDDGCGCGHTHGGSRSNWALTKLLISCALFAAALFFPDGLVKTLLCVAAYGLAGYDVILKALKGKLLMDENMLMVIATVGAFFIKDYAEAAAVMLFFQAGELIQDLAVSRSRKSISALMDIRVDSANLLVNATAVPTPCEQIHPGDLILVSAGEKVPLDGIVVEGATALDTSALTGESLPRDAAVGDEILSGSVNLNGTVKVKVTKEFGQSTVSRILDLVENSSAKKSQAENFITKFARYYTPIVVAMAALLAIIPPLFDGNWSQWVYRGLSFLVVSCPCALVISVPMSFFGGIGGASRNGILIKGSNFMEALAKTKTAVFDKTGTLTKGTFTVDKIQSSLPEEKLLRIAASVERYSSHPIAASIRSAYGHPIEEDRLSQVEELAGLGISARVDGTRYYAGNEKLMAQLGYACQTPDATGTLVYVADENQCLGYLLIKDTLKPETALGLRQLHEIGVTDTVMLTGDNRQTGEAVAKELGINQVYTQLLPTDKVHRVETLLSNRQKDQPLIFTGDGINDAPVLALADVGIAMGGVGSDAAIEAADVVLMTDQITKIPLAIKICRKTLKIVKENIILALGIKAAVLLIISLGYGSMWMAIFADVGVSLLAILNALRCLKAPKQ